MTSHRGTQGGTLARLLIATLLMLALALTSIACGGDSAGTTDDSATATFATRPPGHPTPAPEGEATPGVPRKLGYRLVQTLPQADWDQMLGFAVVPGTTNEALVFVQDGTIWRLALDGSSAPALFAGLTSKLIKPLGREEGLLGFAFSPKFTSDRRMFLFYTAGNPRRSVLSSFRVENDALDLTSEHVLLELPKSDSNHNGGQLAFGPDGYLYVGVGDGGGFGDPNGNGQDLGTLFGKILRLDVSSGGEYSVPRDNPFVDRAGARAEVYAYGFRNPWRFSFDRATGDLWAGDVGQDKWEEVDRVRAGGNYGWNITEGESCYRKSDCDTDGLLPPRAVYSHDEGCSVTGGYVYRGTALRELAGWYVFGDFCSGKIWAANTADASPPLLLADTGASISSFAELPSGELLVLTYLNAIFQIERVE